MAARKTKDQDINLLPQKGFQTSTAGRILAWILSTFRIIVIVTEIIVMIAFLSRFWFDAQNTDLNEKIQQKKAVLLASREFESRFNDVQNRLSIFSGVTSNKTKYAEILKFITSSLPNDILLTKVSISKGNLEVQGLTSNEKSIQQLIVNLSSNDSLKGVGLKSINTQKTNPSILEFAITTNINLGKEKG